MFCLRIVVAFPHFWCQREGADSMLRESNGNSLGTATITNGDAQSGIGAEFFGDAGFDVSASTIGAGFSGAFVISYSGDSNYAGGSSTTTVTINEPAGAAIALTNSGNITIATAGTSGTSTITVTPSSGFGGAVDLTCALTSGTGTKVPTCTVVSTSVSISGSTAQTATLTIATTAATSESRKVLSASSKKSPSLWTGLGGGMALAGVLFFAVPRRRKFWISLICFFALSLAMLPMGYGGAGNSGSGSGSGSAGTTAGTYTFTVTGTHGTITGSTIITVVVD